jgi:hypothetical protein
MDVPAIEECPSTRICRGRDMDFAKRVLAGAGLAVLFLGSPALAESHAKIVGLWKLVSFQTEDVKSRTTTNVYGEHPKGYMAVIDDGRFYAHALSDWPQPAQSLLDENAQSLPEYAPTGRGILYSGTYRLEANKFIVHVDRASHEGLVGVLPFDLTWTEGRTPTEEVRYYSLDSDGVERETLRIETAPILNPNGAGNTIIGRVIWERSSN